MTQDEIIRMAREAGLIEVFSQYGDMHIKQAKPELLERFAALVAAYVKSDQINTAYQQGCEDMKRRMEKRMQQLEAQLQLCQTAVADEREACAKVCDKYATGGDGSRYDMGRLDASTSCAAAIRARSEKCLRL